LSERVEAMAAHDLSDVDPQFRWRAVRAKVLARRGEYAAAETLAHESVSLIAHTDWLNQRANLQMDLAEVLQRAGRRDEALAAVEEAIHLFEAKENRVAATRARGRLADLSLSGA
jgi:Flp pilus assembly protein TadD